jgi:hypothetical protein
MTRSKAQKFADDQVVVATDGFIAGLADGTEIVVGRGQTFRGRDPVVLQHGAWFAPFGTPEAEWDNPALQRERVLVATDPEVDTSGPVKPRLTVDSPGALRVRRSWQGLMSGAGDGTRYMAVLREGELVQETMSVVKMIRRDKKLAAELLEPAK